jgi:energy-coupling factor transporter ATP-binding protein EcfA2
VETGKEAVCPEPRYDEPYFWWGPGWHTPKPRGIAELLQDGTIDPLSAATLWAALERRRSLAVIAGPSGVGKTTLLTALLEFLPADTKRVYLRGCFESFAFLSDPTVDAEKTALLVNEISPHLPVYLWGAAVERALQAAHNGFTLLATAHAASVQEFVAALTGSPLRISATLIAAIEFVVVLEATTTNQSGRMVQAIWRLRPTREGIALARSPATTDDISQEFPLASTSHNPPWFPHDEILERTRILTDLRAMTISTLPAAEEGGQTGVLPTEGKGKQTHSP